MRNDSFACGLPHGSTPGLKKKRILAYNSINVKEVEMKFRIKRPLNGVIPAGLSPWDIVLYFGSLVVCFLLFQHSDLFHTSSSSYAYFKGHFSDFYDYNKSVIGGNDYLPLIYVIFAIWNIPLYLFGLMHDVAGTGIQLGIVELVWTKSLIAVFYFGTMFLVYKIASFISGEKEESKTIAVVFVSSPIAFFAAFIFGQYDIIGVFFTMLGFYFYLKNEHAKFSFFLSLAISLKFFAVIIYIPLLLLAEKRILHLVKNGLIALSATVLQVLFYLNNEAFRGNIFSLAGGKASGLIKLELSRLNNSPYLIIFFSIICIYCFIKESNTTAEKNKNAIYISLISYITMFSTVIWHPQWFIILMPFWALNYLYVKDKAKSYLFDIVGMFSFIYIVVNKFPNNVDSNMLSTGAFRSFFSYIPLHNKSLFVKPLTTVFMGIFFVYLLSPFLVQIFQKNNDSKKESDTKNTVNFLRFRFFFGIAIFVLPSLFCAIAPKSIAQKIDPEAYTIQGLEIDRKDAKTGKVSNALKVTQTFIGEYDGLTSIRMQIDLDDKTANSEITATLFDESHGTAASRKIMTDRLDPDSLSLFFPPVPQSKGKMFYLEISSNDPVDSRLSLWKSASDSYGAGDLYENGTKTSGDLCIELIYDR